MSKRDSQPGKQAPRMSNVTLRDASEIRAATAGRPVSPSLKDMPDVSTLTRAQLNWQVARCVRCGVAAVGRRWGGAPLPLLF
jgi:hypothetical protein